MKYLLLVYIDPELLEQATAEQQRRAHPDEHDDPATGQKHHQGPQQQQPGRTAAHGGDDFSIGTGGHLVLLFWALT